MDFEELNKIKSYFYILSFFLEIKFILQSSEATVDINNQ